MRGGRLLGSKCWGWGWLELGAGAEGGGHGGLVVDGLEMSLSGGMSGF